VAFTPGGHVVVQTREPAALELVTMNPPRRIVLSQTSRADTGHAIFHASTPSGLACASCHPEGGEDGRAWRFQKLGPRRTQSLRGGVLATAPFHWGGDFATISDLTRDLFETRMRGPRLDDEHREALGRWLDRIPAIARGPALDAAAVERGRQLFQSPSLGCASCHQGVAFTNNLTADVGTGRPFQVPTLRALALRAPFMHDGCAATLAARFTDGTCGGGDQHGLTSALTAPQLADLTAYLETL
jgi:cytochrome c peroxidase